MARFHWIVVLMLLSVAVVAHADSSPPKLKIEQEAAATVPQTIAVLKAIEATRTLLDALLEKHSDLTKQIEKLRAEIDSIWSKGDEPSDEDRERIKNLEAQIAKLEQARQSIRDDVAAALVKLRQLEIDLAAARKKEQAALAKARPEVRKAVEAQVARVLADLSKTRGKCKFCKGT